MAQRLKILFETARMRETDGLTTLRTLEGFRQCVAQSWDDLRGIDGESSHGLAAHFVFSDQPASDLLTSSGCCREG
ncbi:hypothetical protein [Streptomyces sp. NPDC055060]